MKGAPITTGVSAARVGADGAALPSAAPPSLPDAAHPATSAITAIATPPLTIDFIRQHPHGQRSEEHTSELQSLMRISYAVFCLKKKKIKKTQQQQRIQATEQNNHNVIQQY